MKILLKIYLISFFFQSTIVFSSGSIEVNIPTLIGALITPYIILNLKTSLKNSFNLLLVLILWLFLRTAFEYGINTYVLSLFQLLCAIIPSIAIYNFSNDYKFRNEIILILKLQLILFLPLVLRDYGFFNLSFFDNLFGGVSFSTRNESFGIKRSRASFYEPSYFGIYLCLLFIIFKKRKNNKYWLVLIILELITTFSFGSFILLIIILILDSINKISFKKIFKSFVFISVSFFIFSQTTLGKKLQSVVSERIEISYQAIAFGVLTGSEGSRINSLPVAINFAIENPKNFFFGEGYTYRNWLKMKYGGDVLNQFGEGHIFNTFAAVIFHGGMIALIIYLLFIMKIFKSLKIDNSFVLIFLYIHFTYSGLQSYFLWMIILFANIYSSKKSI